MHRLSGVCANFVAEVQTVAWDGDPPQRATFDLCILRATWNYYHFSRAVFGLVPSSWFRNDTVEPVLRRRVELQ